MISGFMQVFMHRFMHYAGGCINLCVVAW